MFKMRDKKGQIAIYVIVALVIVAGILVFFFVRGRFMISEVPAEFVPIYEFYESCIEYEAESAADLAGSQGGGIFLDDYVPGSEYAPFSSHLNFLGFPVPYWFYVSGNGLVMEDVPTESEIEREMERFIEERVNDCDFEEFYARGYYVELGEPEVKVEIEDERLVVDVNAAVVATNGEGVSARRTEHSVDVNSKFGKFFEIAKRIYAEEREGAFLEDYALDVLNIYAPVDGVELDCGAVVWTTSEVVDDLKDGLEANIGAIKLDGDYYKLSEKRREYYVIDEEVDESVNFLYSGNWPTKVEIHGADDEIMIARPVGNQAGASLMGFCYVPYHFVYDISFPVVIQVYDDEEIFQFPVAVIIDDNLPRKAEFGELVLEEEEDEVCDFKTEEIEVSLFDVNLNPVDGEISYVCFDNQCSLGKTVNGKFVGGAPACYNGYLDVRAEGYVDTRQLFSSNSKSVANIILDREHEVEVDLRVGGEEFDGTAVVLFAGERSASAVLPGFDSVTLSEEQYNVTVYVYGDSEITIPASTERQCHDVPRTGLLGLFGAVREECFDVTIPETKIENALIGGGESEIYILESELREGRVTVDVDRLPTPKSLQDLQYNFEAFSDKNVRLTFR